MNIEAFSPDEQKALRECVAAVRALPIYKSPDFEEIFGYSKIEVENVYATFPNWELYDEAPTGSDDSGGVLRNAFAWLLNGDEEPNLTTVGLGLVNVLLLGCRVINRWTKRGKVW